ncbi:MAG: hypothetical protein IOD01_10765 [Rhodobacter sp.]|jgi:hypothetical protein|nr:hypothetical protein [Rhodobacter sp.]
MKEKESLLSEDSKITFGAQVFFSAPVKISSLDWLSELKRTYPSLQFGNDPFFHLLKVLEMDRVIDTSATKMELLLSGTTENMSESEGLLDSMSVTVRAAFEGSDFPSEFSEESKSRCRVENPNLYIDILQQRIMFLDLDTVIPDIASGIEVFVTARETDFKGRIRAATLCSCLIAVLARREEALAVFWSTAGHFLTPSAAISMAESAVSASLPVAYWIGARLIPFNIDGSLGSQVSSVGLRKFTGYEFWIAACKIPPENAFGFFYEALGELTMKGNLVMDGECINISERGSDDGSSYAAGTWYAHWFKPGTLGQDYLFLVLFRSDCPQPALDSFGLKSPGERVSPDDKFPGKDAYQSALDKLM